MIIVTKTLYNIVFLIKVMESLYPESIEVEFRSYPGYGGATAEVPRHWAGKKVTFFFAGKQWGIEEKIRPIYIKDLDITLVRMSSSERGKVVMSLVDE
jgi:hypothetical protein